MRVKCMVETKNPGHCRKMAVIEWWRFDCICLHALHNRTSLMSAINNNKKFFFCYSGHIKGHGQLLKNNPGYNVTFVPVVNSLFVLLP